MYVKEYLDELVERGREIIFLDNVSREYEVTRYVYENRDKVIVFKLKGSDITCYTNIFSDRRDLYSILKVENDIEAYERIIYALNNPIKPDLADFNEYFIETNYTLDHMPFIKYFREDGGYYLTSSIIIACIGDICNASYHRMMYRNNREAVVRIVPRHLYRIYRGYSEKGEDTPVAVVLGVDPLFGVFAASTPPYGVFELESFISLEQREKIVKTPKYRIPVPSSSSIVLEGVISSREYSDEGPFVDVLGLSDTIRKQPVFKLDRIYVNKHTGPYYHAIVPSLWEHILLMGFPREALIYDSVRKVSPNIKAIRLTFGSGGWLHAVVSIKQGRPGEARNVGLAVFNAHPSVKHVVIVDDDINIDDPLMIEWAIATRVKGGEDLIVLKDLYGSTLDPRSDEGLGDKVLVDATKPFNEPWSKYRRASIP
ncbi:MAG: ubiquinone biosynthesis protein UbiD [Desulfurococcales archaeon ex4484_58]|nr:MAG: ubiquinone biosynthesis protein UbiD [Desulfurococcales archaeon ex4484_58]